MPSAGLCTTVVWASWGEVGDTLPCREGMGWRGTAVDAREYQLIPLPQTYRTDACAHTKTKHGRATVQSVKHL